MRTRFSLALVGWISVTLVYGTVFADDTPPITDPNVTPAQFVPPVSPISPTGAPITGMPSNLVADPPTPMVRVQVRVPAHIAPGKEILYRITVVNSSAAEAYRVRVRNPLPEGTTAIVKTEPAADNYDPKRAPPAVPKELIWSLGTLRAGESKTIELTVRPPADAKEVRNQAYVSFEHGQAVTTRIDSPKLAVRKSAPKQVVSSEPIPIRVEITNTSNVTVANVQLVEDVSRGFEFATGTEGEKGGTPQQRLWNLGSLRAGEQKLVSYRLTTVGGGELLTQSAVKSQDVPDAARAESTTKVLVPGLKLDLKGPTGVQPGEPATYEATVTNTGTMPLSEVHVVAGIPDDCTVTKMTNGGQRSRDQLGWTIPDRADGPLRPGESYTVRFGLKASTSGKRTVRVSADPGHNAEQSREAVTVFQASAVLSWRAALDQPTVPAGREGMMTVRITNSGGDPARNTRLRIELPPGVRVVEASPKRFQAAAGELIFDAITVPASGSETFTVTFRPEKPGQAWFHLKLYADALGEQPLRKEQEVQVTGR